ncbi:type II toxin-antitoxin system RelE/ParE family toxin [Dyadobacter sp. CY261]|uniref:type II toxin-antitoxin system RelE/ParE family toxin n=1 Tax=Dyadobacter sp. CY261 TaxID=2907203 RepID=UPI00286E1DDE|nr:type II toxin-antitoxin system RelE/ParE family toxin [Dyadobacter sp. CY261]
MKTDVIKLVNSLSADPTQGIPLGQNCFKIRLAIKSKGKGKSGGARVITFVVVLSETVVLLSIYDKSDKENISSEELADLLQSL